MREHKYKLTFDMQPHPDGISGNKVEQMDKFGTDALFWASIIYPEDGSLSVMFGSLDGRNGKELNDHEWFKVFMLLSARLAESKSLDAGRIALAKCAWDMIRKTIFGGRAS
jgi:hypothetical protein